MGGALERQIRTTSKIMSSTARQQVLDDEGLVTLMCNVEAIINGRPLTIVSDDARDLKPLTPNDLLLLRNGTDITTLTDKTDSYCKRRWRQVQYLSNVFWQRWVREYLPLLQTRNKWNIQRRNLKIGDIVLLIDDDIPRNRWLLGRVLEVFKGSDGNVRTVKVKTGQTTLIRPINKLCLLETVERSEDSQANC